MTFSLGDIFKVHVFGESHGACVGVVVEGCPPGMKIDTELIQRDLDRRRPGNSKLVSPRREKDQLEMLSGISSGRTTGAPISMIVKNSDVDSSAYEVFRRKPRPGHADYPARIKYNDFNDSRGGGIFSGRMTVAFVMAGAIAKQLLGFSGIDIIAFTTQIGNVHLKTEIQVEKLRTEVYRNAVRTIDIGSVQLMTAEIMNAKNDKDSVGGVIECHILGLPVGVGEPLFDSVESCISHAIFSIPGVKGIEFGSGFSGSSKRGSENNDSLIIKDGDIRWSKNDAGGILGGITNGAPVIFRVAIKPTPTIGKKQQTVDLGEMKETEISGAGRHDPCIVPRAVPVVEAMAAITIIDLMMKHIPILEQKFKRN
ncbi:MAG: chorismate synthase [Candidatus Thorarchaeota archaeon]